MLTNARITMLEKRQAEFAARIEAQLKELEEKIDKENVDTKIEIASNFATVEQSIADIRSQLVSKKPKKTK